MERNQTGFLETLEAPYRGSGSQAYHPRLMLRIVLYEILDARRSPAQWHRDIPVSKALLWLGRGIQPSRTDCYTFRDRVGSILQSVHEGLMKQSLTEGLLKGETGVLDGTFVRACASRHRIVNHKTLTLRLEQLEAARTMSALFPAICDRFGIASGDGLGCLRSGNRQRDARSHDRCHKAYRR